MEKSILIRIRNKFYQFPESTLVIFLILLMIIIYAVNNRFFSLANIITILRSLVPYFIIACGVTFVITSGELDLSIGSLLGFASYLIAYSDKTLGLPVIISIPLVITATAFLGFLNGIMVTRLKIPSLIVTLGMMYSVRGLIFIITRGGTISDLSEGLKKIGEGVIFQVPYIVIVALIIGIVSLLILNNTKFGYHIKGVGGNKIAAEAAAIDSRKIKTLAFIITGICCSIAGILVVARANIATPATGQGYELFVIAAVIIGGTSLFGGVGTIFGTFLGALFFSILQNGLILMKIDAYWHQFISGFIIILAVGIDILKRNRMLR